MSQTEEQLKQIELSIEEAKGHIAKMDALLRLTKNPDFQLIIDNGYFKEEAARLVLLKAAPVMADESKQKAIIDGITGIGELYQYLQTIVNMGRSAEGALVYHYSEQEELLKDEQSADSEE